MKNIADKCGRTAADKLPYASTRNVARDMDIIRGVLRESKISYLGWSYGADLGTVYMQMFPARVDRVVLDSSADASRGRRGVQRLMASGTEIAFARFARWVAASDATHHLGGTATAVRSTFDGLVARANQRPVRVGVPGGKTFTLTGDEIRLRTPYLLYRPPADWGVLVDLITTGARRCPGPARQRDPARRGLSRTD